MFKKEYQGGTHVEVFSAQGRDPLSPWKLTGSVSRDYLKDVRGYVVTMEGGSSTTNTKMQLPKTDKASLALVQPYLVFQLMVPDGARLAIDLSVVDKSGSRRRVQMSTSQREIAANPLNARVPLSGILTGQWINLCLDLASIVTGLFKSQSFKSLEGITIGGSCVLRRVFTLTSSPPDTTGEGSLEGLPSEEIPRVCQMPTGGTTVQTQVMSYASVSSPSHDKADSTVGSVSTLGSSSSKNVVTADERPTHIAFGQKVTIPDHILASKQASRSTLPSRQSSADTARGTREIASLDGQSLQPRPPSKPADPTVLRVQKTRVRALSGGKQKVFQTDTSSQSSNIPSSTSIDSGFQAGINDTASNVTESNTALRQSFGLTTASRENKRTVVVPQTDTHLAQDEHLALNVLKYKDDSDKGDTSQNTGGIGEVFNTSGVSDDYLNSTGESQPLESSISSSVRQGELDTSVDEVLYTYCSLPKSAERRPSEQDCIDTLDNGRSVGLDEDFVSPVRESKTSAHFVAPVAEVRPRSSRVKKQDPSLLESVKNVTTSPDNGQEADEQLNETRLSDDYDWRQYASVEGTDPAQSENSLRTRLANAQQSTPRALTLRPESDMEGTLSGSVTLSGWTEKFKDAAINPLHDSLDTRDMGGMLSPLGGTLTDEPDFAVDPNQGKTEGEELELMYDPQLNCFYDPVTGKYYELAQ